MGQNLYCYRGKTFSLWLTVANYVINHEICSTNFNENSLEISMIYILYMYTTLLLAMQFVLYTYV